MGGSGHQGGRRRRRRHLSGVELVGLGGAVDTLTVHDSDDGIGGLCCLEGDA